FEGVALLIKGYDLLNVVDVLMDIGFIVIAGDIWKDRATIIWYTDKPSTSQVEYGLDTAYGSETEPDEALVNIHKVIVTGLDTNLKYHFRIRSVLEGGREIISRDYEFPNWDDYLAVSNVVAGNAQAGRITICWETNSPATAQVFYGETASLGSESSIITNYKIFNVVDVTGLFIDTTYYYKARSTRPVGFSAESDIYSFYVSGIRDVVVYFPNPILSYSIIKDYKSTSISVDPMLLAVYSDITPGDDLFGEKEVSQAQFLSDTQVISSFVNFGTITNVDRGLTYIYDGGNEQTVY
ncbi:MAG: hypothetical protein QME52_13590, partial [Bacteroidota bacterium]|nr:hypothetical protein [Bacteroidota bacterium]